MIPDMMSFVQCLYLREDNPLLINFIKSLGYNLIVEKEEDFGFFPMRDAGVECRFKKEALLVDEGEVADDVYRLMSIGFYAKGYEGYEQFRGRLVNTLAFADRADGVRAALGEPSETGGGQTVGKVVVDRWERFDLAADYSIRLSYTNSGQVGCITLSVPQSKRKGRKYFR